MGGMNLFARVDWKKLKLLVSWPSKLQELTSLTPWNSRSVFLDVGPSSLAGRPDVPKDSRFQPPRLKTRRNVRFSWLFSEASGTFVRPRHWLSLFVHVTWRTGRGKTPQTFIRGGYASGIADRLLPRLVHLERELYGIVGIKSGSGTWVCVAQTKQRWYVL